MPNKSVFNLDNGGLARLVGHTPMIRLQIRGSQVTVFAKLEGFNLTGSVKDRMSAFLLKQAIISGKLKSDGTILEATTGNTGIAFSALAAIHGYSMVAVMPQGQSAERIDMMRLYGTKVVITPKEEGPAGAIKVRNQLAKEIPNSWVPDQFANPNNPLAYEALAQEIMDQTAGDFDFLVHGIGTGGTLMGLAKVLKESIPDLKVLAVEHAESAVLSGKNPGEHGIQGIGEGFIPGIVNPGLLDEVVKVSTQEAVTQAKALAKSGLLVGFSSGANVAAINKLYSRGIKTGRIVTIFADRGERYLSTLKDYEDL